MTTETGATHRTRGPYRNGEKRRQTIVRAATTVFGGYGYHGASLRQIADLVDTTPATLLAHFGSKEGLLIAVLREWQIDSSPPVDTSIGLASFRSFLLLMRYHERHRGLIELFLTMSIEASQEDHPARPFILERQRTTLENFEGQLKNAMDAGEILPMTRDQRMLEAQLLVGTLDGTEMLWVLRPDVDLEALVRHHMDASISRWSGRSYDEVSEETERWLSAHAPGAEAGNG